MHLMIDLETLSLQPNCVVTQIGYVLFDELTIYGSFLLRPDPEEQIKRGRHVSFSTFSWWLKQDEPARLSMAKGSEMSMLDCLNLFIRDVQNACGWENVKQVWSNGLLFDVVIMQDLFYHYELEIPWHYRAPRDVKTLCYLIPDFEMTKPTTAHDANADAFAQAVSVQRALETIQDWKSSDERNLQDNANPRAV